MTDLFFAVTEALVRHDAHPPLSVPEDAALRSAAAFTRGQIGALRGPLQWGMCAGLVVFRTSVRLRYLRGFSKLHLDTRRQVLEWWAFGPIPLTRKLFKPIRTTALLAYYEYAAQPDSERAHF